MKRIRPPPVFLFSLSPRNYKAKYPLTVYKITVYFGKTATSFVFLNSLTFHKNMFSSEAAVHDREIYHGSHFKSHDRKFLQL